VSKNPGQGVILCVWCILGKHVSNGKELTVMSENMRKVISVYTTTNRYYRILESITVLNMNTLGCEIVGIEYF
jgi:hypothetical protein